MIFNKKEKIVEIPENETWEYLASEYRVLSRKYEKICEQREEIKQKLISFLGDKEKKEGNGIRLFKSVCKGAVDYAKIPQLKNLDLEPYRKVSFTKYTINFTA